LGGRSVVSFFPRAPRLKGGIRGPPGGPGAAPGVRTGGGDPSFVGNRRGARGPFPRGSQVWGAFTAGDDGRGFWGAPGFPPGSDGSLGRRSGRGAQSRAASDLVHLRNPGGPWGGAVGFTARGVFVFPVSFAGTGGPARPRPGGPERGGASRGRGGHLSSAGRSLGRDSANPWAIFPGGVPGTAEEPHPRIRPAFPSFESGWDELPLSNGSAFSHCLTRARQRTTGTGGFVWGKFPPPPGSARAFFFWGPFFFSRDHSRFGGGTGKIPRAVHGPTGARCWGSWGPRATRPQTRFGRTRGGAAGISGAQKKNFFRALFLSGSLGGGGRPRGPSRTVHQGAGLRAFPHVVTANSRLGSAIPFWDVRHPKAGKDRPPVSPPQKKLLGEQNPVGGCGRPSRPPKPARGPEVRSEPALANAA